MVYLVLVSTNSFYGQSASPRDSGVFGENAAGAGVKGTGGGYGGDFNGGLAPLHLTPSNSAGPPRATTNIHNVGEFIVDNQGTFFMHR